ncbi:MAG TPA: hypothetical protein VGC99_11410 [Candidatus Tectomicrobia bacterium]
MSGPVKRLATNPILRQGAYSYFLSKEPLTAALHYLLALATVLFVIWPKSQYLRVGSPPLTFDIEVIVATVIMAYLSFSYGAGKLGDEVAQVSPRILISQGLPRRGMVAGLTVLTLGHTLFFVVLALPLLVAAAHVSGVSSENFGRALLLMVICTLAYRWLGLLTLCVWETQDFMRYVVARAAFVVIVLGSAFFLPSVNPLLGLISMSFGEELGQVVMLFHYELSYATVALIIHLLLLLGAYIMVLTLLKN